MYESPISVFVSDITTEILNEQENEIMKAVMSVGVNVDKDELVKALRYDRQQYDKGYSEGYAAAQTDISRWISVEEQLPDDYSRVLGFMAWGGMMLLERQSKEWYLADRIQQAPDEAVLYWMPLPAPPKEVQDG